MTNEQRYTLDEAAGEVGVRADDLPALLPNAGVDMAAPGMRVAPCPKRR